MVNALALARKVRGRLRRSEGQAELPLARLRDTVVQSRGAL
jgi:hypothetical protein